MNRIQPYETTARVIAKARSCGFRSTNLDLIYGLPLQSVETYSRTLDQTLELRPERLAVYNYAHLPHLFKVQRQIREEQLPGPDEKLAILELTIRRLTEAGYVYIGMDHFALPEDELAQAQRAGTLHRNFQGYSTRAECDLVGLGSPPLARWARATVRTCVIWRPTTPAWMKAGCRSSGAWSSAPTINCAAT